jgi:hypothetical protein
MWFGIGFLILLVVLYLVATSAVFLKSVILPRVGKSMNATITVTAQRPGTAPDRTRSPGPLQFVQDHWRHDQSG